MKKFINIINILKIYIYIYIYIYILFIIFLLENIIIIFLNNFFILNIKIYINKFKYYCY